MNERAPAPGGLALVEALVNTLSVDTGEDRLAETFALSGDELAGAEELREALRAACLAHAGQDMPPEAAGTLTRLLSGAPLVVTVDQEGAAALSAAGDGSGLTARIAAAVAEAVTAGTWSRLKACEAEDCRWAYYDRSPAGRSRWCTMSVCGSRAKMRTYRAKRTPKP
ncbi:CGNR zinc finger domain-containing protein [Streptomyces sp. A3M-1-3]|uniref:CGNR zinc finger domain-containing protein n=1 Tax=Streptomyces sp. A3M-1-3 TaxID=2962044 RepID=UPI0020B7DAAA|nr:CGNR zinc finger domain-containing protein [Streptomyces sp. A3M-1-3]MCP3820500.1 CGNR zinc finger domain-containing protein [Streptomyces sp. A3M-1-3]